ncbi:MFS transporter [Ottowia sp. GY511]|uniref:MFS transporter n=1 Tax=Ottowia flava TaxID=2675430 RepID=A0ABW4KNL5_9BURK|nr:MFS transporter [Ottowia sp. GY511]TXK28276.1 MFS transporter [Ottowia sp. GY511]
MNPTPGAPEPADPPGRPDIEATGVGSAHPAPSPAPSAPDGLPQPARRWAMVCILIGIGLSVLDSSVVNLALPTIARDFGGPAAHSIWIVNAYQLAVLMLLLPFATLGDKVGYRKVYIGGVMGMLVGSAGCLLARDMPTLIAWRAVQGVGAAGLMGVNAALVRLTYPRAELGRGMAINSATVAATSVGGPAIAAAVLSVAHWPWLFAINLPLLAGLLWLAPRTLPSPRGNPAIRLRLGDVLQNACTFALIFLGVELLGTRASSSATPNLTLGAAMLLAGLAIGAWYVRGQLARSTPLLPVDLMRNPVFALTVGTSVLSFAAQTLGFVAMPFLLLGEHGRSTAEAGLLMSAWPLGSIVVAPLAGRLIGRVNAGVLVAMGLGILSLGLVLLATLPAAASSVHIGLCMALCGVGFALFQSPNNFTLVTSAPTHRSGGASGMLGTARLIGQTSGAVAVAIVFSAVGSRTGGPITALFLGALSAFVAGMLSLRRRAALASV